MSIELQNIDCNCNNCKFMVRDFDKLKLHKESILGNGATSKLQFGNCDKLNKAVSFIPNVCQLDTQECFENRR